MRSSFFLGLALSVLFGSAFVPSLRAKAGAEKPSLDSPVGRWKTVDDVTGKPKSVVTIWEEHGKLYGRVQKLVDPDPKNPNPTCEDCTGETKGKPVVGLKILWDLQKDGDGSCSWQSPLAHLGTSRPPYWCCTRPERVTRIR